MTIAETLQWNVDLTEVSGVIVSRSTAVTPDRRTAIEIIGPPEDLRLISVVGELTTVDGARQLAALMAMAMRLVLPNWRGADPWLAQSLRSVKRTSHAIAMHGWKVRMEWLSASSTVTLKATR